MNYIYFLLLFLVFNLGHPIFSLLFIRAEKGEDQYLFLQLGMEEENLTTVLTMDMQTVSSLLPLLGLVEMEASLVMLRDVQR